MEYFPDTVEELLEKLVSIRSYSGEEQSILNYIKSWLEHYGIESKLIHRDGSFYLHSVLGKGEKSLLFFGHCDTVSVSEGWKSDPFKLKKINNKLYGLGSMDMKAGLVAMLLTYKNYYSSSNIIKDRLELAIFGDEEMFSRGAKLFIELNKQKYSGALLFEPSFQNPQISGSGKALLQIKVIGKPGHLSFKNSGINAIEEGITLMNHILKNDKYISILKIKGGKEKYELTIPSTCELLINKVIVKGEDRNSIIKKIEKYISECKLKAQFEVEIIEPYYPYYSTDGDSSLVSLFKRSYYTHFGKEANFIHTNSVCDANLIACAYQVPIIVFGPEGQNMHSPNEFVYLDQIVETVHFYTKFTNNFFGEEEQ